MREREKMPLGLVVFVALVLGAFTYVRWRTDWWQTPVPLFEHMEMCKRNCGPGRRIDMLIAPYEHTSTFTCSCGDRGYTKDLGVKYPHSLQVPP